MCDFHSVIVDGAGRIYHLPSNSHSEIARVYNLDNADLNSPFWECEWNGIGEQPPILCQNRGKNTIEPTALAVSAIDRHYAKLAKIMSGESENHWSMSTPFNTPEYTDVPARIEWAAEEIQRRADLDKAKAKRAAERKTAELLAETMFNMFGEALESLPDAAMVMAIRAFIEKTSVTMEETASEEIELATEDMISTDSAHDYVLGDGGYIAEDDIDYYVERSDDYFTQSQLDDAIDDAKREWKREALEALTEAVENVG